LRFQTGKEENAVATAGISPAMSRGIQSACRREEAPQEEHLQTGEDSEDGHARPPGQAYKPRAPAPTSSFSSFPSSSGSSFTDMPDFTGWLQTASSLSLGVAQACFLDLIPYLFEY
jgi:hypothetical protein